MKIIKVFNALTFYLNPNRIYRTLYKGISTKRFLKEGFIIFEPNYLIYHDFNENDTVIDVGCGFEVELASYFIDNFNMNGICVDPTKKHQPYIEKIVQRYNGKLQYMPAALCANDCQITFNETLDNESGSLLSDHTNVLKDKINQYTVEGISLQTLIQRVNAKEIAFIKIDIEGAEYDLFKEISAETLLNCRQIFIEFHHISVKSHSVKETHSIVNKIKNIGYEVYTRDKLNYLFVRK